MAQKKTLAKLKKMIRGKKKKPSIENKGLLILSRVEYGFHTEGKIIDWFDSEKYWKWD